MKVLSVDVVPLKLRLRLPYKSAKKGEVVGQQYLETLIVKVRTDDGLVGYGEIPSVPRMFETIDCFY